MFAHAIAQIEPPIAGVHLLWTGPQVWVFSPGGWTIQRRRHQPQRTAFTCAGFDAAGLATLRKEREARLPFGVATLRDGNWLAPVAGASRAKAPACEVATLELDAPQSSVRVQVNAGAAFATALRDGKVVDTAGPSSAGQATLALEGHALDTIVVYARKPATLAFCIPSSKGESPRAWADVPAIVEGLQLPLRELMPAVVDEYAEARSRLLDGETLDPAGFAGVADMLRAAAVACGPPRPIDVTLLTRETPGEVAQEMAALDLLRVLAVDPTWRRALGFGWFDRDPALVPGERYDYRITGSFPAEDLGDRVYGFHMMPSQTTLPADLYLGELRVRLAQPG